MDICLLSSALKKPKYLAVIEAYYNKLADENSLTSLNTAYAKEGAYIYIPKNKEVEKILNNAGINNLNNHLLESSGYGYSGAFIKWGMGGSSILDFPVVDHANWEFNEYGTPFLIAKDGVRHNLKEYNKNNIIFHQFK